MPKSLLSAYSSGERTEGPADYTGTKAHSFTGKLSTGFGNWKATSDLGRSSFKERQGLATREQNRGRVKTEWLQYERNFKHITC